MRSVLFLATLALLGAILFRPISGSAAPAYGRGCGYERELTPAQIARGQQTYLSPSAYLAAVRAITIASADNLDGQTGLIDELTGDYSLLSDTEWLFEMGNCLDDQDAYYSQVTALRAPYQFTDYQHEVERSYLLLTLAGDEVRNYLLDHDSRHVDAAGAYYDMAVAHLTKATSLLNASGYSL
jgi:hypothetical protein